MSDDAASLPDEGPYQLLSVVSGVPPFVESSSAPEGPGGALLVRGGDLRGKALDELGGILEQAMTSPHAVVRLDLTAVSGWSTLAQAMVLHSARVLERRGARLVLVGASANLRRQGQWLDLFDRIDSEG